MTFDIAAFRRIHNHNNQLANINDETIQFWVDASIMLLGLDKTTCIIKDEKDKALALQLLVCHVCAMVIKQMVGVMGSASEGSVSVSQSQLPPNLSRSYLCTTPCGLLLYQLLSRYMKGIRWYSYKRR